VIEGGGPSRSTDPAAGTSQATDVSLREHLMQAIEHSRRECQEGIKNVEKAIAQAQRNNDENIKKALAAIDKRFDSVNEFRDSLSDLSNRMATKVDLENLADKQAIGDKALGDKFEALHQHNRQDIDRINERLNLREGEQIGSRLTTGSMIAIASVLFGLIAAIVVIANYLS
jgi:hypothetical protein